MSNPDSIASAFLLRGSADQWPTQNGTVPPKRTTPLDGIGIAFSTGSWPCWDAESASSRITVWRNPNLWDQPARYGSVVPWQRRLHPDGLYSFGQLLNDIEVNRVPLLVPWASGWKGAGGTTSDKDNGLIINYDDGTGYEILGLRRLEDEFNRWAINAKGLKDSARIGHYWCDAVRHRRPGYTPKGSQGPKWKLDGLFTPQHLDGPWSRPVSFVGFNVQAGTGATAAAGGWVEHPLQEQPYKGHPVTLPLGDSLLMIPCWTTFRLDITNAQIEQWIIDQGLVPTSAAANSKRNFARGLRDQGWQLSESGTGNPVIESKGSLVADVRAEFAARGLVTETHYRNLGKNVFNYGRVYVYS